MELRAAGAQQAEEEARTRDSALLRQREDLMRQVYTAQRALARATDAAAQERDRAASDAEAVLQRVQEEGAARVRALEGRLASVERARGSLASKLAGAPYLFVFSAAVVCSCCCLQRRQADAHARGCLASVERGHRSWPARLLVRHLVDVVSSAVVSPEGCRVALCS